VKKLKATGRYVRGVDIKEHEFESSVADEFAVLDLRNQADADAAVLIDGKPADEVYMLAADMGGMGFIHSAECEIMRNSALININMTHAAATAGVPRYFFSSSVCIYRDMLPGEPELTEDDAVPADPDNEYGWEKLYAERTAQAYGRRFGMTVRIARFQNCYGPLGTWTGGREKAPAALCRKVALADPGGTIQIWGDGEQTRSFCFVDDCVEGLARIMRSDYAQPLNLGTDRMVTINELARIVIDISGKQDLTLEHVEGPQGVRGRNSDNTLLREVLGWEPRMDLEEGLLPTYRWIEKQVARSS